MMKDSQKIRVMLVDDHFAVLLGLRACLKPEADITVVAEATDGRGAIEQYREHQPDITLMDLHLPRLDGVEAIRAILQEFPGARIVVLSTRHGDEDYHRALAAGARSYLTKSMSRQEILTTIRAVHRGEEHLPQEVRKALAQRQERPELTSRELAVLHHLARGRSNKEIAAALGVAEITVKVHVSHILAKMKVLDRSQIVMAALRLGLIHLDDAP